MFQQCNCIHFSKSGSQSQDSDLNMHLTNIVQAIETVPRKRYTAIRLARIEAEAKDIWHIIIEGARNLCLMNQDVKNMPFAGYKRPRDDEEDENPAKRCRFIDDEAEELNMIVDSGSKEGERVEFEKDDFISADDELYWSSKEPRRWSLCSLSVDSES